ncbi:MAG: XdhC family protein [Granulosicoccus sp.]
MSPHEDIGDIVYRMKRQGGSFAVATVVRTLSVTAAKPGAKAIIDHDGNIVEGWIGGGCARSAVIKAAVKSIADGEPRFVSIHPDEVLSEQGMIAGEETDGRWIANNMCPSKGSMELFIEPFLANPELLISGSSPVASSVSQLAEFFNFSVVLVGSAVDRTEVEYPRHYLQWSDVPVEHSHRYILIATQGAGDLNALSSALSVQSRHIGFVGSHRKMAHLRNELSVSMHDTSALALVKGPAGLDIGAVTPNEIALSILAELVQIRRCVKAESPSQFHHKN